jgi:threonine synthase
MTTLRLECPFCRKAGDPKAQTCGACGEPLEVVSDGALGAGFDSRAPGVWRYRELLPPLTSPPVSLREGGTPLYDCGPFRVKFEGANPTGSFKDRGMTAALSLARDRGTKLVVCASTGNTAASLAAYAARGGLRSAVLVPEGKIAAGKLAQAVAYGAQVLQVQGNFDQALAALREALRVRRDAELLNSVHPVRIEGQKTIAFEICDELGCAPDAIVIPVGNGGHTRAIWKGLKEYRRLGRIRALPRLIGAQAEGAAWLRDGALENPETVATAIRIGRPVNGRYAREAIAESGGEVVAVSDAEILDAQRRLASSHGIFVEPASAAPVAALSKVRLTGTVVCVATGHGLKDPGAVRLDDRIERVPARADRISDALHV